ncbi:hypothetical protein F5Y15DRAFT_147827 [Xylariaceae sp. FL0016]|nr:hypothetical protein F5Y15DRAFT_147827 [Xylariaceae sp. FL0016]
MLLESQYEKSNIHSPELERRHSLPGCGRSGRSIKSTLSCFRPKCVSMALITPTRRPLRAYHYFPVSGHAAAEAPDGRHHTGRTHVMAVSHTCRRPCPCQTQRLSTFSSCVPQIVRYHPIITHDLVRTSPPCLASRSGRPPLCVSAWFAWGKRCRNQYWSRPSHTPQLRTTLPPVKQRCGGRLFAASRPTSNHRTNVRPLRKSLFPAHHSMHVVIPGYMQTRNHTYLGG